jgi:outer membrane protein
MNKPFAVLGLLAALAPGVVRAESLFDAIDLAYQTNPTLRAQRAELRATDEQYVQARAGLGPQVSVTGQVGYQNARVRQSQFGFSSATDYSAGTAQADLSAVQPIYTAGQTTAQVRGAEAGVKAGREALRQAENELLQKVVTAYLDVRRDRQIVGVLKEEIVALTAAHNEIMAKGRFGELGKTDVAQSEERLLSAQAQLNLALGRLNASNAAYLNIVGQSPGELEPEPELAGMPAKADDAFEAAEHNNPQLLGAIANELVARQKVNQAKAANGPTISIRVDAAAAPIDPYLQRQYDTSVTAAAVITQPLFTSGLNSSKIRQALEEDNRAQLEIESTRRGVVQQVAQAWDQLVSTRQAIAIEQRQLVVENVAVKGNRIEERVGLRSVIDLLNAELELANTNVGLIQSRHDEYVARAALLAAMGLLEAKFQTPGVQTYSPEGSLKRVERRGGAPWSDAIAIVDHIGAPSSPPPPAAKSGSASAGAERPAELPPLPATAP